MPDNDRRVTGSLSTVRETGGGYLVRAEITHNGEPDEAYDLSNTVYIMRGGDVLTSENGVELDPGKTATVDLEVTDHDGEVVSLYYGDEPGALDSTTLVAPEPTPLPESKATTETEDLRTEVETLNDAVAELRAELDALEDRLGEEIEDGGERDSPLSRDGIVSAGRQILRALTR